MPKQTSPQTRSRRARPFSPPARCCGGPASDAVGAGDRDHPPSPIRRLVTSQGQSRPRRNRTRHRRARGGTRRPATRAHLGRRLAAVSYPVEQSIKKVRYWAARTVGGEFSPNSRGRRAQVAARRRSDEATGVSARPKGAAPLRETARRHEDGADRPARHGGQQVAVQGRRPKAATGQARSRSGRVARRSSCWRSAPTCSTPPTGLRCHQTLEPLAEELGVDIHDEPLLTEEAYAENRKAARHRILEIAAAGRHAGDLHTGQGDSRPDRVVV